MPEDFFSSYLKDDFSAILDTMVGHGLRPDEAGQKKIAVLHLIYVSFT